MIDQGDVFRLADEEDDERDWEVPASYRGNSRAQYGIKGFVYFLACPSLNLVKIGFSKNPLGRWNVAKAFCPVPVEFLGWMAATFNREHEIHRQFSHLNTNREWFRLDDELAKFIEDNVIAGTRVAIPQKRMKIAEVEERRAVEKAERARKAAERAARKAEKVPRPKVRIIVVKPKSPPMKCLLMKTRIGMLEAFEESEAYRADGWEDRPLFKA